MDTDTFYVDEDVGRDDDSATGSEAAPYKTLLFAMIQHPKATYKTRKSETAPADASADPASRLEWKPAAKSALKKATNLYEQHRKKQAKAAELAIREQQEAERRKRVLEEAKKVVIEEDPSLPVPVKIKLNTVDPAKIKLGTADSKGTRVRVVGRVHHLRSQKDIIFITLKDGKGLMQCLFSGNLIKTYAAMTLTLETSLEIRGELKSLPPGAHAPLDRELHADFFTVIGAAVGDKEAITNKVQEDGDVQKLLDNRHLTLRGDISSSVMKVRAAVEMAFIKAYEEVEFTKVSPPAMVQTQVEGGATLFEFNYYGEKAYLTQSSQLYLETCLPGLGDVYCIEKSFRAEKSLTRRHLSEYTHVEAELDFITFDDLLNHIEHMVCRVIEITLADPVIAKYIYDLNPDFKPPSRPFKRMRYSEAITWLVEHEIPNEEGKPHTFGDDIAEAAERRMTDILNVPIFLTHFPTEIKAFYMQKDPSDPRVTESVDVLMPGVGEIVGGSMRIWDYEELIAAYKREGIDPEPYYWYTDQRRYGTTPHGGYGLGLERFLAWMCGRWTVRECCLYPRFAYRCKP
ncbi:asparagine-tRNA ligase [Cladophialophora bantiana CBS 173.52]|uniref:asparagine--tRNA ligase n=1 Tax=Cladophialophora bantiana (strain ATCC 10958 / CBS 173.52 / CDC B-1940 / NIH 8579) TaxID=1442370 RepID=A0A0D2IPE6_CLAB1|nr:asparagine-tRNA ligase [Cladophialophora bantiana CBS 173.52]KIW98664.1 asparagine-tRNA ligase [Cladophialophora bantiana CBS 173.52]